MPKKGGLGKGLSALMSQASEETGSNAQQANLVDIDKVYPNPNQPRTLFNEEKLDELSESIKSVGILQPLLVHETDKGYEIIAGERRYQAALKAGLKELPVQIKDVTPRELIELALIENLQRSDLNPIEEARGYRHLMNEAKLTQEQLAQAVSKSRSAIANALRLLDLPDEIQDMLFDGLLTAGHARAILAVPDAEKRVKLAEKVVADRLSVRQTENLAPLFSVDPAAKPARTASPQSYKLAARRLRKVLDTNVRVKAVKDKNRIEIEFRDEEDLLRILKKFEIGE